MGVPGRNNPCPCGSGKKFKRCCGDRHGLAAAPARNATQPPSAATSATIPLVGPPGVPTFLVVHNEFVKGDPRNEGGPTGASGAYRVVFTLCRPGYAPRPETALSFEAGIEGDSHLAISPPAVHWSNGSTLVGLRINTVTPHGHLSFRAVPNGKGFLAKLASDEFQSFDLKTAYRTALGAIGGFLSTTAVFSDIPLEIYQGDVTELRTGTSALLYVNSYRATPPGRLTALGLPDDFRLYASLYREALTSNSPSYQFLCFFKIIEGARLRHARRSAESRELGMPVKRKARETIPSSRAEQVEWLDGIFTRASTWDDMTLESTFLPEAIGLTSNRVVDRYLTPIRKRVAHAFLESGEPTFSIDEPKEVDVVVRWLPLTKCLARVSMKSEFPDGFLRQGDTPVQPSREKGPEQGTEP